MKEQTVYKTIEEVETFLKYKGWTQYNQYFNGDYFISLYPEFKNKYFWTHDKYKLSGGIVVLIKDCKVIITGVLTNCLVDCCGLKLDEVEFSSTNLKKLIETGIYNYGKDKRSY